MQIRPPRSFSDQLGQTDFCQNVPCNNGSIAGAGEVGSGLQTLGPPLSASPLGGGHGPPPGWEHKHDSVLLTSHLDGGGSPPHPGGGSFPLYVSSFF